MLRLATPHLLITAPLTSRGKAFLALLLVRHYSRTLVATPPKALISATFFANVVRTEFLMAATTRRPGRRHPGARYAGPP